MPARDNPPALVAPRDAADLRTLAWLDDLLRENLADVLKRDRLARASGQRTLSLVLEAQAASLTRIRATIHARYWSLRTGAPHTDQTLSNRG